MHNMHPACIAREINSSHSLSLYDLVFPLFRSEMTTCPTEALVCLCGAVFSGLLDRLAQAFSRILISWG